MHLFNEETQVFLECDSSSSKWITLWRPLQWLHRSPLLTAGWIIKTDFLQFKTWSSKLTFSGNHSLPCLHPSGSSDPLNKPKGMEKSHEITHCSQRSLWNNVLNFCRGKSGERGRFSHVSSFSQPNLGHCYHLQLRLQKLSAFETALKSNVRSPNTGHWIKIPSCFKKFVQHFLNPNCLKKQVILSASCFKIQYWHLSSCLFFWRD